MSVISVNQFVKFIQSRFLGFVLLALTGMTLMAFLFIDSEPKQELQEKSAMLAVRNIGHHLLLHTGDSSSRVLPVTQSGRGIFQLEFQNRFSFVPDSLVKIAQLSLGSSGFSLNYMVNIFDCSTKAMVYGFEVRSPGNSTIPCLGRTQPIGCYRLQVTFPDLAQADAGYASYYITFITLAGLTALTFVWQSANKRKKSDTLPPQHKSWLIGKYEFDEKQSTLRCNDGIIQLSNKESKVLSILAASANQLVDRDHLLKEVWENEGVITGRSLDMFISRLRKKLEHDPSLKIVNIHGKGYKLEVV